MGNRYSKIFTFVLIFCFILNQIQPAFAYNNLSPALSTDNTMGVERPGVIEDIGRELEPGAIGRGTPYVDMVRGILPEGIDVKGIPLSGVLQRKIPEDAQFGIDPNLLRKLVASMRLAIQKAQENLDEVPSEHKVRAASTIQNLARTLYCFYNDEFEKVRLFRAVVRDKDNYLLGFYYRDMPGLAIDLIAFLDLDDAAEYIFHEHIPEEHEIGHKIAYEEIQAPIFWREGRNTLGVNLRRFIDRRIGTAEHVAEFAVGYEGYQWNEDVPEGQQLSLEGFQLRYGVRDHSFGDPYDSEEDRDRKVGDERYKRIVRPGDVLGGSIGIFPTSLATSAIKIFRDLRKIVEFDNNAVEFKQMLASVISHLGGKESLTEHETKILAFLNVLKHVTETTGLTPDQERNAANLPESEHVDAQKSVEEEIRTYLHNNIETLKQFIPTLMDASTEDMVDYLAQAQGLYTENAVLAAYFRAFRLLSFTVFAVEKDAKPSTRRDKVGSDPKDSIMLGLTFYRSINNAQGASVLLRREQEYLSDTGRVNYETNFTRFLEDRDPLIDRALSVPDGELKSFVEENLVSLANVLSTEPYVGKTEADMSHFELGKPNGFTVLSLVATLDGQEIQRRSEREAKKATTREEVLKKATAQPEWALDIFKGLDGAVREGALREEDLPPVEKFWLSLGKMVRIAGEKFSRTANATYAAEAMAAYFLKSEETVKAMDPPMPSVETIGGAPANPPHYIAAMPSVWRTLRDATKAQYDVLIKRIGEGGGKTDTAFRGSPVTSRTEDLGQLIAFFAAFAEITKEYEGREIERLVPIYAYDRSRETVEIESVYATRKQRAESQTSGGDRISVELRSLNLTLQEDWVLEGKVAMARPTSLPLSRLYHEGYDVKVWTHVMVAGVWTAKVAAADGSSVNVSGYHPLKVVTSGDITINTAELNKVLNDNDKRGVFATVEGVKELYGAEYVEFYTPTDIKRKMGEEEAEVENVTQPEEGSVADEVEADIDAVDEGPSGQAIRKKLGLVDRDERAERESAEYDGAETMERVREAILRVAFEDEESREEIRRLISITHGDSESLFNRLISGEVPMMLERGGNYASSIAVERLIKISKKSDSHKEKVREILKIILKNMRDLDPAFRWINIELLKGRIVMRRDFLQMMVGEGIELMTALNILEKLYENGWARKIDSNTVTIVASERRLEEGLPGVSPDVNSAIINALRQSQKESQLIDWPLVESLEDEFMQAARGKESQGLARALRNGYKLVSGARPDATQEREAVDSFVMWEEDISSEGGTEDAEQEAISRKIEIDENIIISPEDAARIEAIINPSTVQALLNAQDFYAPNMIEGLRRLLAKFSEKKFLLAIDMEIGGPAQQGLLNTLLKQISDLQKEGEFKNLLTVRGMGENLSGRIQNLVRQTEGLDIENVVLIGRQENVESDKFKVLEGRAVIAGIEDRGAYRQSYLPVLETIAIALGIAYEAEYDAVKSIYDLITDDGYTLTKENFEKIIRNRVIKIIPRASSINIDELRSIYERALQAIIRA